MNIYSFLYLPGTPQDAQVSMSSFTPYLYIEDGKVIGTPTNSDLFCHEKTDTQMYKS